jgi:hydroxymethylbilane synthase
MTQTITIGTRGSQLALWQAHTVADLIRSNYDNVNVELRIFTTRGDKILDKALPEIGGKGLFTEELETALRDGEIDCAVHSLKDLPTEHVDGIDIGAIPERGAFEDVLVSKNNVPLSELPQGATVGTSSLRRKAQLLNVRNDLNIIDIRGNVPTRIEKLHADDSPYDAIVLARAGVERLELGQHITEVLSDPVMLNAPAQGAIGIQCREEPDSMAFFSPLMNLQTWLAVTAERAFLQMLGGGCSLPVAAYAHIENSTLYLHGRVTAVDGSAQIDVHNKVGLIRESNIIESASQLGARTAQEALEQGATAILESLNL